MPRSIAVAALAALSILLGSARFTEAKDGHSLKDTAADFVAAAFRGDAARARSLVLTFDEISSLSTKVVDRADYDRDVDEHLADLKLAAAKTGRLVELRIVDVVSLPASTSSRRKRDMVLAVVKPIFADPETTEVWEMMQGSLYFVPTAAGWRLSIRK